MPRPQELEKGRHARRFLEVCKLYFEVCTERVQVRVLSATASVAHGVCARRTHAECEGAVWCDGMQARHSSTQVHSARLCTWPNLLRDGRWQRARKTVSNSTQGKCGKCV
eukprot:1059094-Pleurochrysis_carterae.AAC.1